MTPGEAVQKSIEDRKRHREAKHPCPMCGCDDPPLVPLGGPGSYWFEHACGAYSPLCLTLEEALATDALHWHLVDPGLNACMYPPVGMP